jgi:hypothetical protein
MSSARTKLRDAIKACVKEMIVAVGYNYSYIDVNDPPMNMEKMTRFPAVNILYGTERRQGDRYMGNNPTLDIFLPVQFDVFINEISNTTLAQDKVIADFQKYFGENYYVKPVAGDRTAFNCIWLANTIWGTQVEKPSCGVSIDFEFFYSIKLNDPNTMT